MLAGLICSFYLILFALGVGTNGWTLARAVCVFGKLVSLDRNRETDARFSLRLKRLLGVVCLLALTNLALLSCLCFVISDVLAQGWQLGRGICCFYWWSENFSKTFVAFVLIAFSLERYADASKREGQQKILGANSFTLFGCAVAGAAATVVLAAPIQPYVGVQVQTHDDLDYGNHTKCGISLSVPRAPIRFHIVGTFLFAYMVPFVALFCCYAGVVRDGVSRTMMHSEESGDNASSSDPEYGLNATHISTLLSSDSRALFSKRVTMITLLLMLLYIFCWSPYWLSTLTMEFAQQDNVLTRQFALFLCHALPYVNAVAAGLLYMSLAKKIREVIRATWGLEHGKTLDAHELAADACEFSSGTDVI